MKKITTEKKRKILRAIYGTLSFSTALFVFQACYGIQSDFRLDVSIQGFVKSKTTNQPISGIKVSFENQPQYVFTDSKGSFKIYTLQDAVYKMKFEDVDSSNNGLYFPKDSIVKIIDESTFLNISLDAK